MSMRVFLHGQDPSRGNGKIRLGKNCASAFMNPVHLSFGGGLGFGGFGCFWLFFFFNSLPVDAIIRSMLVCRLTRGRPTQQFVVAD